MPNGLTATDTTDSARIITKDFDFFEELLSLGTAKGRSSGVDIFENFKDKCNKFDLDMNTFVSVCTDRAPCMIYNKGF